MTSSIRPSTATPSAQTVTFLGIFARALYIELATAVWSTGTPQRHTVIVALLMTPTRQRCQRSRGVTCWSQVPAAQAPAMCAPRDLPPRPRLGAAACRHTGTGFVGQHGLACAWGATNPAAAIVTVATAGCAASCAFSSGVAKAAEALA